MSETEATTTTEPTDVTKETTDVTTHIQTAEAKEAQAAVAAQLGTGATEPWFYDDEKAGEGAPPEWLLRDKYKTVVGQAKAYPELQKRFGGFSGSPEEYEYSVFTSKGIEADVNDPFLKQATAIAKETNMNQETFDKLLGVWAEDQMSQVPDTEAEMAKLGENGKAQLDSLAEWAQRQLSEEEFTHLTSLLTTASDVRLFQKMRALTQEKAIPTTEHAKSFEPVLTKEKIVHLVADPKYGSDPYYREEVQRKIREFAGE